MTHPADDDAAPPRRGGYRKGAERRTQILDEMIRMVAEQGVDASSLRSVAEALGITHAALRHYFPSRDELLLAVYREHEVREQGAPDRLKSAIGDMRDSASRNRAVPGLVQLYTTLAADAVQEGHPATRDFMRERFTRLRADLAALIAADQAAGRIRGDLDPVDLASLSIAASDGLQVQWLLDPEAVDGEKVLRLLEQIVPAPPE
ncbi:MULTISPECIES: TetR/AcrR family transcriptional regulator [unclassified Curtobacterium]|uniref:TetR/AcrR family transcriptional regulator n=1 Tax=Bacteria TaxID=2 RepID=UPI001051FD83|nr:MULTISPECIES: TetR/AcrR family transcriptional regulator [unclassified Curtobacterium]NQW90200.1 TetR/AcrR family transcriptional regulator [Curtobacterium sp. VKM Ac-2861]MBF4586557.1 TetR/AcrR family transcriptional regulator [Curtobacterium sp. VKM Ac-2887]TCL79635.1 TetR family transcriptional regulator [Curtobacterium sp. PhB128]TCL88555.1 TetR family transcriptional regulator [Curtobacterium sp. PhB142]TCL98191.1 TetR family transcriptional regulator [Curtobacterium sp. PhB138]